VSALARLRHWISERAEDVRAPPIAFTCMAFLSVILGAQLKSVLWIGATLILDLCAMLLWGRPAPHFRVARPTPDEAGRLQRALVACLARSPGLDVESVVVEGEPFGEPAAMFTRSPVAGTLYVRGDRLSALSELQLQAIVTRELVHLARRDDVRRWIMTAVSLFLLVAGSAAVALLRLCLGSRVGAVDLLGSVAACFVGAPTAVFLLQYVLHDIEFQADREVARRDPALATALIEWLQREDVHPPHLFVVIPQLAPFAAQRVQHLVRLSGPATRAAGWKSRARPLSALGAVALLAGLAVVVAELMNGRVPDVAMDASPAAAARKAIAAAESVQQAVKGFAPPAAVEAEDSRILAARAQVEALRAAFDRPRRERR